MVKNTHKGAINTRILHFGNNDCCKIIFTRPHGRKRVEDKINSVMK